MCEFPRVVRHQYTHVEKVPEDVVDERTAREGLVAAVVA